VSGGAGAIGGFIPGIAAGAFVSRVGGLSATVIASDYNATYENGSFIFTTVTSNMDGTHPVSGNREFGYYKTGENRYTFYTSGVDRTNPASHFAPTYGRGASLWEAWQQDSKKYIEGGMWDKDKVIDGYTGVPNSKRAEANVKRSFAEQFNIEYGCRP
jgi:hypothetical protein